MAREIEVRFLEIDKADLVQRLLSLGAHDKGDDVLEEIIIYDKDLLWVGEKRLVRLRTRNGKTMLTYKHHIAQTAEGTEEVEFEVSDPAKAEEFLTKLGFEPYRRQQKKRHSFTFGNATFDIDTWPQVPTYVEIEAGSEEELKEAAQSVGLDWAGAVFEDPRMVLKNRYQIPLDTLRWYTFDRVE